MYGAMPSDFMVFEVGVEESVEDTEIEQASTPDVDGATWDVNHRCVRVCHIVQFVLRSCILCTCIKICVSIINPDTGTHDGTLFVERRGVE